MTYNIPVGYSFLEARYSGLSRRFARLPIGDFPTRLETLGKQQTGLWVKRDDQTHDVYGGNKIRKLEYLLADALRKQSTQVVTFGGVGSNHALATALHSRAAGLDCTCLLMPQRMTSFIAGTLQRHQENGTALLCSPRQRAARVAQMRELRDQHAGKLAVVPLGGTSARGSLGYVNAAFELAAQWRRPEPPARVYLAAGTMGTAAGLAVGFRMLGWPTSVVAARVVNPSQCNDAAMARLCDKLGVLLRNADRRVPHLPDAGANVTIRGEYLGDDYAHATPAAERAVYEADERWGLPLETTYTGKAMACMLDDLADKPAHEQWLFWHTYSGRPAGRSAALGQNYARFLSLCTD